VAKRFFDLMLSLITLFVFFFPMLLIGVMIFVASPGPILHWSSRVGKDNKIFKMPKFRSMYVDTPCVATHLLSDPSKYVTGIGTILRKTSLDELPQIWCIIKGDMSFVGPRPALDSQNDVIKLRELNNVSELVPGLTGWAQVNGRDELSVIDKVRLDSEYREKRSITFDIYILWLTVSRVFSRAGVSH
jgi:O-antigen biosynthesis protein WbqP